MAYNTVYPVVEDAPVARYVKTVSASVTGFRLDQKREKQIEFCISADDPKEKYDESVLELYSEAEERFFRRANRLLFERGLIRAYEEGSAPAVNMANFMDDTEITRIASIRRANDLAAAIENITSPATLQRILLVADERGMTKKLRDMIEAKSVQHRI